MPCCYEARNLYLCGKLINEMFLEPVSFMKKNIVPIVVFLFIMLLLVLSVRADILEKDAHEAICLLLLTGTVLWLSCRLRRVQALAEPPLEVQAEQTASGVLSEKEPETACMEVCRTAADRKLLAAAAEIVRKRIDDPSLDIADLCKGLGVGRSKLFQKFKDLADTTPGHFILSERLRHAAALLRTQPGLSVGEVGDLCGFASAAYFSVSFKRMYGCTPSEYRRRRD